jgi:hypothetical protein
MVDIRIVWMAMTERLVHVSMRMRLAGRRRAVVVMPVMRVVFVPMLVLHPLVNVLMLVTFTDMEPDAEDHEGCRQSQPQRDRLAEHDDADHRTHEGRR